MTMLLLLLLAQPPAQKVDACALIPNAAVKRVLGADATQRTPSTQDARGVLLYQCFIATGTPRSVSLAVAGNLKSGAATLTPRAYWRQHFRKESAEGDEEGAADMRPIAGIGDEAFWSGARIAGALYVLHGSTFIRVSVGGIPDEQERIDKSRELAAAALEALDK